MGLKHKQHETWGVQFHPESILTTSGMKLIENFLTLCRTAGVAPGGHPSERTGPRT
jgi:GMP synthase-like glutamine amidotransferase